VKIAVLSFGKNGPDRVTESSPELIGEKCFLCTGATVSTALIPAFGTHWDLIILRKFRRLPKLFCLSRWPVSRELESSSMNQEPARISSVSRYASDCAASIPPKKSNPWRDG
jgi:hypothetical protein